MSRPSSHYEQFLRTAHGYKIIAGVDEVGCGCLAGPVVSAAVILPFSARLPQLNDSKQLSESVRERLATRIKTIAVWAIGISSVEEIDVLGIRAATLLASQRAISTLSCAPDAVVSDAFMIPGLAMPCHPLVRADSRVRSVAAASIMAKVHRDRFMSEEAERYPEFGFAQHKGYGTSQHLQALHMFGPTPLHRKTFAPVQQVMEQHAAQAFVASASGSPES